MNTRKIISLLISVRFTLICMVLAMLVILVGTLAQAEIGTFAAQKIYFNQFFIYGPQVGNIKIPIMPGGLTVGLLWFINLLSMMIFRIRFTKRNAGVLLIHLGLLVLLVGQFLTQQHAHESRLAFEEGETKNFIESSQDIELAVVMTSDPERDQLTSIPLSVVKKRSEISSSQLPFSLHVQRFFPNALIQQDGGGQDNPVTQGIGTQLSITHIPITTQDDEMNTVSAIVEIKEGTESRGTWLLSTALGAPQSLTIQEKQYTLFLRPKRFYLPYSLTLKDFTHDRYPGTNIPKNFSSLVELDNPQTGEQRDVLIYMNNPLRYEGHTFYQASFGKEDTLSVLQVVKNPAWLTPYISCIMVVIGLGIQFIATFILKKRRKIHP